MPSDAGRITRAPVNLLHSDLASAEFLAVDVETNGRGSEACELTEVGAVVGSAKDEGERYEEGAIEPPPRYVVRTAGAAGGSWTGAEGRTGSWEAAALPGPAVDAYGCGDSFAAGFTFGLGDGRGIEGALELGARCGAACMTGRGPYAGQLRL